MCEVVTHVIASDASVVALIFDQDNYLCDDQIIVRARCLLCPLVACL